MRGTEGEAPDSGARTTTMTELLVESTDGVVLHNQFTKLRFTELEGQKDDAKPLWAECNV